jgi:dihydropteroate synthase
VESLLTAGCGGIDIGGQGSTFAATLAPWETEWERVRPALAESTQRCQEVSIDTWRVEVAELAFQNGATTLNAANGMQTEEFWELAAKYEVNVVLPFMNGDDPLQLTHVEGDPLDRMLEFFEDRLAVAATYGLRDRCLLDPGTGFGPHGWEWADRFIYQKHVYSNIDRLRVFGLPLYIPLPWKVTPDHDELLEIVLAKDPEYGRVHYPARVLEVYRRVVPTAEP